MLFYQNTFSPEKHTYNQEYQNFFWGLHYVYSEV